MLAEEQTRSEADEHRELRDGTSEGQLRKLAEANTVSRCLFAGKRHASSAHGTTFLNPISGQANFDTVVRSSDSHLKAKFSSTQLAFGGRTNLKNALAGRRMSCINR